ncbi:hypothetical protein FSP39_011382 [Pinctada imbricata]|uniref:Plastocyanin-like domain-containing protein n=1 Tax=Pinctada imbricata TaxID=66713 RepID=A0AA89C1F6_PINIB|nr:hypothetical protein FSP39_011382 [Pinctada imbricata]
MTMIDDVLGAVYPSNGSLYELRDKNNDNDSRPISTDGVITADGWTIPRLVIVANRTMPGPTIIATKGQRLKVKVINKLRAETVAIHWHGITQKGTPYMDGVPFITQCPILPGNFFTYGFDLLESGTYFYHSHIAVQQADGLFGALIIQDTNEGRYSRFCAAGPGMES